MARLAMLGKFTVRLESLLKVLRALEGGLTMGGAGLMSRANTSHAHAM